MAGRKNKERVDYFPHYVKHGATMDIIDQMYGNDGYSFWFRILEALGDSSGHYYDMNAPIKRLYLTSKSHLSEDRSFQILDTLAELDAIDQKLWIHKIIWSQNFVDGISDVYRRRKTSPPEKPKISDFAINDDINTKDVNINAINDDINTQSKVKESKEEESIYKVEIEKIIDHMNLISGKSYRPTSKDALSLIPKRLKEGFTVEQIQNMLSSRWKIWGGTEQEQYYRPETVFGNKMEGYVNAVGTENNRASNGKPNLNDKIDNFFENFEQEINQSIKDVTPKKGLSWQN